MIPYINTIHADIVKNIIGIFFDIDDTFTIAGKIPSIAFQALWDLKNAGLKVVPITGRPAGWCDHIARMWPCLLYTSPSPRDQRGSRMPSSA